MFGSKVAKTTVFEVRREGTGRHLHPKDATILKTTVDGIRKV